jgi:hypothetical protein
MNLTAGRFCGTVGAVERGGIPHQQRPDAERPERAPLGARARGQRPEAKRSRASTTSIRTAPRGGARRLPVCAATKSAGPVGSGTSAC